MGYFKKIILKNFRNFNIYEGEFSKNCNIFYGENGTFNVKLKSVGVSKTYKLHFNGIINFIKEQARLSYVKSIERWANNYMSEHSCPECEGSRLNK